MNRAGFELKKPDFVEKHGNKKAVGEGRHFLTDQPRLFAKGRKKVRQGCPNLACGIFFPNEADSYLEMI